MHEIKNTARSFSFKAESISESKDTPEIRALKREKAKLKKRIAEIEKEIVGLENAASSNAKQQFGTVANADPELSKLWRKHFDAMEAATEAYSEDDPEWEPSDRELRRIYAQVAKKYGKAMADAMADHSEKLATQKGRTVSAKMRQFRAEHGVSDQYFDPNDDFY